MLLWIASFRMASASNFLTVIIFSVPRGYAPSCRSEERSSRQFLPRSRAFAPSICNPPRPWFWWLSSCNGLTSKRYLFLLTSRETHGRNMTLFDDSKLISSVEFNEIRIYVPPALWNRESDSRFLYLRLCSMIYTEYQTRMA